MSQSDIAALKDALCAQQKLLQKLYNELEAEREASATAASEALSVILRLQGEKAAVKMEAEQYKRLAEEKMCHAEESFAIIEDIITQKEMEMADLDYQVQTYKYQLMSHGLIDPSDDDIKIPDQLMHVGEANLHHFARRDSAPLLVKYKKAMVEGENSPNSELGGFVSTNVDEQTGIDLHNVVSDSAGKKGEGSIHGGISSYADQIRELENRVKEIAGGNYASPSFSAQPSVGNLSTLSNSASMRHETGPPSPRLSFISSHDGNKVPFVNETGQAKAPASILKKGQVVDHPCSLSILDVFEVPQAKSYEPISNDYEETTDQEILDSKDCVSSEAYKSYDKDEPDWLKKLLHSTHNEQNLCKPSDIAAIDRGVVQPTTSVSESEPLLNRGNGNSEITEVEREEDTIPRREEELKLLKEIKQIKEKLSLLQAEIRYQKQKKSSIREKPISLSSLSEAMLYFWL